MVQKSSLKKNKYRNESIVVVGESCYLRHVTVLIYPSQKKSPLSVVSVKNIIFYFVLQQFAELLKIFYFFTFNMVRFEYHNYLTAKSFL